MNLSLSIATPDDIMDIVSIKNDAATDLSVRFGKGHWSHMATEKTVLNGMLGNSKLLVAKNNNVAAGTLRLVTKKPWAIDPAFFTKVPQPLYLLDMVVAPHLQRGGIGRHIMQEVKSFVTSWPAQAVRLDAYDHPAGAGEFYRKCGYTERGRVIYRNVPLIYFEQLF